MVGLPSDHALVEDDECLRFNDLNSSLEANFLDVMYVVHVHLLLGTKITL